MAGLVPAIHVLLAEASQESVDARDKRGHDGEEGDSISNGTRSKHVGDAIRRGVSELVMAGLIDDDEAVALRELFAGMDAGEEADATSAMSEAAAFLRKHHLSFRHIVQEIEVRGLLLPSKVGAAIQLMDSTTLSEAQGALAGARRLMRSCGLTFARVIGALDQESVEADEIERLRLAYQIEVERSREMAAELQFLRANAEGAAGPSSQPASAAFKKLVVVATLLLGLFLAGSIASTIADLLRSANATAPQQGSAVARRENGDHSSTPRANTICWRNRSIHGPCFQ